MKNLCKKNLISKKYIVSAVRSATPIIIFGPIIGVRSDNLSITGVGRRRPYVEGLITFLFG
jgi:hypothetical protein